MEQFAWPIGIDSAEALGEVFKEQFGWPIGIDTMETIGGAVVRWELQLAFPVSIPDESACGRAWPGERIVDRIIAKYKDGDVFASYPGKVSISGIV